MIRVATITRENIRQSRVDRRLKDDARELLEKYPAAQRVILADRGGPTGRAGSVNPEYPTDIVLIRRTWGKTEILRLGAAVGPTIHAIRDVQRTQAYDLLVARGLVQQLVVEIVNRHFAAATSTMSVCADLVEEAGLHEACVDIPYMIRQAVYAFEEAFDRAPDS